MKLKEEFEAKVKELEDLIDFYSKINQSFDIIKHNVSETKSVDFGFKVQRGDEIFTITDFGNIWTWIDQAIADACKKQREICAEYYMEQSLEKSWGAREIIENAPLPKEDKKYYCKDCGTEMDKGEASAFTCCEVCWDKHYKNQSPKESE